MPDLHDDILQHRAWLLTFLEIPAGGVLLDLGCGRGEDLRALAAGAPERPAALIGLDSSAQFLADARSLAAGDPRLRFQQHDIREPLPFEDGAADVVCSSNLLECLPDPSALVQEVARVLRPGGRIVVGHWDWDSQVFDGTDRARIRRLVHAFADWKQEWMKHADPWMGRRLWGLFNGSGYFTGSVRSASE